MKTTLSADDQIIPTVPFEGSQHPRALALWCGTAASLLTSIKKTWAQSSAWAVGLILIRQPLAVEEHVSTGVVVTWHQGYTLELGVAYF